MSADHLVFLRKLLAGDDLTAEQAASFAGGVMDAAYTPVQSAGLLVALAAKGEHADEIAGAARAMRERSVRVHHDLPQVVDVVGTGGDGANTINVSTMAALVVAAAGLPVAKHGNRAASSACGSADVLEAAGFPIDVCAETAALMLREAGFAFLFAPSYHPAMRNAAPVRRELGVRTIFNVLGPLTNPARATHQVVGVAKQSLVQTIGEALRALGVRRGAVVHAANGLDEVAGDVPTLVYSFDEEQARSWVLEPQAYGVSESLASIVGGSVEACREAFCSILSGVSSPGANVVALNAALVLHAIGEEPRLEDALERSKSILSRASAWDVFERAKALAAHG